MKLEEKLKKIEENITPDLIYISNEDIKFVQDLLELNEMTELEQLRQVRNGTVLHFKGEAVMMNIASEGCFNEDSMKFLILTSMVTHCIDMRIAELGFME